MLKIWFFELSDMCRPDVMEKTFQGCEHLKERKTGG